MNVAIACPGPSLSLVTQADVAGYDAILCVNRAALRIRCHYWACLDYPLIRDYRAKVLGNPVLLTHSRTWEDIRRKVAPFPSVVLLEEVEAWYGQKYFRRTTPAAMLLAGFLIKDIDASGRIDLFGDDKTPAPDFDGFQTAETGLARNLERWASERKDCDAIMQFLGERGIEVRHRQVVETSS